MALRYIYIDNCHGRVFQLIILLTYRIISSLSLKLHDIATFAINSTKEKAEFMLLFELSSEIRCVKASSKGHCLPRDRACVVLSAALPGPSVPRVCPGDDAAPQPPARCRQLRCARWRNSTGTGRDLLLQPPPAGGALGPAVRGALR